MNKDFPYKEFKKHLLWKVLKRGIKNLQANGDIEEKTAREYIVGYLSKLLVESNLIAVVPGQSIPRPMNPLHRPQFSRGGLIVDNVMKKRTKKKQPPVPSPVPAGPEPALPVEFAAPFVVTSLVSLQDLQSRYISHVLKEHNNDRQQVCKVLGVSIKTLYNWIGPRRSGRYSWQKFREATEA